MTIEELKRHLGERLRRWMLANGVSSRELAGRCGVSPAAPIRWTSGKSLPRAYELRCLSEATGLSADDLLGLR